MSGESPNVIMYDVNGQEMSVSNGSAIPAGTSALMIAGSDGTNSRFITLDSSGRTVSVGAGVAGTPAGGVFSIQGVAGGTSIPVTLSGGGDTVATGALNALNATVPIVLQGTSGVAMQLNAGTLVGTIVPEISFDGGTTWVATFFDDPSTGNKVGSIVFAANNAANNTATARVLASADGASNIRVRVSAFTSGTATCNLRGSSQNEPVVLFSGTAGGVLPPTIAQMGGTDGSNLRAMSTDTSGHPVIVGPGTAGTPAGGVVTIQGISGGTVVPGNITQFGGVAISTGTGTSGTGIPRVTVSNDSNILATQSGTWTVQPGNTANTTPWLTTINQGGNSAVVKAASTAAVATDPALVVSVSPNSIAPIRINDTTGSGAISALNGTVVMSAAGASTITLNISGVWVATLIFESNVGDGVWVSETAINDAFATGAVATSSNGQFIIPCGGFAQIRVRASAYTSGTATVTWNAGVGTNYLNQGIAISNGGAWPFKITDGTNGPVTVKAASTAAVATDPALVVAISPNNAISTAAAYPMTASSYPDQGNYVTTTTASPTLDAFGNLQTRGTVLTDEGSLRDDFTGTTLTTAITGNLTFVNGSTTVTGTNLQSQLLTGQYIKKTADAETLYVQISSIDSATSLTLVSAYAGTSATAASVVSNWQTVTPTGGSFTVANSTVTLACGTTANATGSLRSLGDYLPYSLQYYASVSQRIANQTIYMGFEDVVGAPTQQATVQFTGTVNTQVNFVTSYSAAATDIQTTTVTLPNGSTTATLHVYRIDLSANQVTLSIDGVVVARNSTHLPQPYTQLFITAGVINAATAPASSTSLVIDNVFWENLDRIQIDQDFSGEALPVATVDFNGTASLAALNAAAIATTSGCSTVSFDITGTWVGNIVFEAQNGNGDWWAQSAWVQSGTSLVGNLSANDQCVVPCGGFTQVRARMSAFTSGTAVVQWNVGVGTNVLQTTLVGSPTITVVGDSSAGTTAFGNPVLVGGASIDGNARTILTDTSGRTEIVGAAAAGAAVAGNPVLVAGYDGTNVQYLRTASLNGFNALQVGVTGQAANGSALAGWPLLMAGSDGTDVRNLITNPVNSVQSLQVQNAQDLRKTYSASFTVATATTATDIATIIGSASTVVRVTKIELTGTATTAVTTPILLIKRSAANTGGTSTTSTAVPHDSTDAAATAVVSAYTVNPTGLGAAVGTIRSTKMVFPLTGVLDSIIIWEFGIRNDKPIVLRGVAQNLAINLNSITVTGGSVSGYIEWTEDAT